LIFPNILTSHCKALRTDKQWHSVRLGLDGSVLIGDRFAHFEVVGGLPQPVNWKSDIFGVFLQGSILFGLYPDGDLGPAHSNL
jgi:hypothetical protein